MFKEEEKQLIASVARRVDMTSLPGHHTDDSPIVEITPTYSGLFDQNHRVVNTRRNTTMIVGGARLAMVEWRRVHRKTMLDSVSVKSADCVLQLENNHRDSNINRRQKQVCCSINISFE